MWENQAEEIEETISFSSHRRTWTQHQNNILKYLRESGNIKKWTDIAKKMEQYGIQGRTGKQCRERYHNILERDEKHLAWVQEEEIELMNLHSEYGNKWTLIANRLNKTDNGVKNHFHSKLRKALRKLDKILFALNVERPVPLEIRQLKKILENTEALFNDNSKVNEDIIEISMEVKKKLYFLESTIIQLDDPNEINKYCESLYNDIVFAITGRNKKHKNRVKRKPSDIPNTPVSYLIPPRLQIRHSRSLEDDISQDMNSLVSSVSSQQGGSSQFGGFSSSGLEEASYHGFQGFMEPDEQNIKECHTPKSSCGHQIRRHKTWDENQTLAGVLIRRRSQQENFNLQFDLTESEELVKQKQEIPSQQMFQEPRIQQFTESICSFAINIHSPKGSCNSDTDSFKRQLKKLDTKQGIENNPMSQLGLTRLNGCQNFLI